MSRFGDLLKGKKESISVSSEPVLEVESTSVEPMEEVVHDDVEVALEADLSIKDMNKKELEAYGRTVGIELDRRHSRKKLVRELEDYLGVSDS
jgi:hypothetical protein|tara:strand:+ start:324 stop:602 length:279 start_codon:yes stop_codon:yes gene_type:complete